MSEERIKILNMLAEKKITAEEAEKLISATESQVATVAPAGQSSSAVPKFLRVMVDGSDGEKVNIRVPLAIIRAGMKLSSFMPEQAKDKISEAMGEKGMDFDLSKLDSKNIDEFLIALKELSVDVDSDNEKVKIFCE